MEPIHSEKFHISHTMADCQGRLKPSQLLALIQQVAGSHFELLNQGKLSLEELGLFWAVIRTRVQISRLPCPGESITVQTWPMPTTRVAYPRAVEAVDEQGQILFRCVSLWVLMDVSTRAMVLPGKSGVGVAGISRGTEIAPPASLVPKPLEGRQQRQVRYTELDVNGHMNNTRYLDWVDDLLPGVFHRDHPAAEFTVCYLSEAVEGEMVELHYALDDGNSLRVDAHRSGGTEKPERVFSAQMIFA